MSSAPHGHESWPALPLSGWRDTRDTLYLWTQVVGKVRLALAPHLNHYWQVPLYVTARGLGTSSVPCGDRIFEATFDSVAHELAIATSDGARRAVALASKPVATFHDEVTRALGELGIEVEILTRPVEVEDPIPFEQDTVHRTYDPDFARRFHLALVGASRALEAFRSGFVGKASPVHFFWGSFDLAHTRFSGRRAPEHPPVPHTPRRVVREAYSHELASFGFWPGSGGFEAAFYAYAYPEPEGFSAADLTPPEAFYAPRLGEHILPYEAVRLAPSPEEALRAFFESAYEAAATLGGWDRATLEREAPAPRDEGGRARARSRRGLGA